MHRLAVLADPHYFDLFPGYDFDGVVIEGRDRAAVHTMSDSAASTRLFNEGYFALPAALDACVNEGIRNVVIAGDLSDDGQLSAMNGALRLLSDYETKHGLRFFLTPGNHDAYGMSGRDITRRLLNADGSHVTVTSAASAVEQNDGPTLVESGQRCGGYRVLLEGWGQLGLKRRPEDIHWECPFGTDDRFEARLHDISSPDGKTVHKQLDVSYLVEPEPGLWLMSIDANVFVPRTGRPDNSDPDAFEDSTCAGWSALVLHKRFLLDWMADVAARAEQQGKTLLCFSHYPVIDPLDGTRELELSLLGETMSVQRTPADTVSKAICATGVHTHFSGHMHIYDRASVHDGRNTLTSYAMPSLVAFPAAIAYVHAENRMVDVAFQAIEMRAHEALYPVYSAEAASSGCKTSWLDTRTYGEYLFRQIEEQVTKRMLAHEWPKTLSSFIIGRDLGDLATLAATERPLIDFPTGVSLPGAQQYGIPLTRFIADLHALRMGSEMAFGYISTARLALYWEVAGMFAEKKWPDPTCLQAQFQTLLAMFERFAAKGHTVEWYEAGRIWARRERA